MAATITLKDGTLSIDANNSPLDQILRSISKQSGLLVEGNVRDERVFGRFGPKPPAEVLRDLLTGMGYNVLMSGTGINEVPLKLTITPQNGPATPPSPSSTAKTEEAPLGPGAIPHPPPSTNDDPLTPAERNMRRLQAMQEAREKQDRDGSSH